MAVIGLFILIGVLVFSDDYVSISDLSDLEGLIVNERVVIEGFVDDERVLEGFRILSVNNASVVCDCSRGFLGETVEIYGVVGEFEGEKQIEVLKIVVKEDNV